MTAQEAVRATVVIAGLVIAFTGWVWVDPAMTCGCCRDCGGNVRCASRVDRPGFRFRASSECVVTDPLRAGWLPAEVVGLI